jgi:hypothetical protein
MDQQKFHQVEFGKTKFEVSTQSIIVFVLSIVLSLLSILLMIISLRNILPLPTIIILAVVYLVIAVGLCILMTYAINCMIVGKCIKLTWFYVGLYIFFFCLSMINFLIAFNRGGLPKNEAFSSLLKKSVVSKK